MKNTIFWRKRCVLVALFLSVWSPASFSLRAAPAETVSALINGGFEEGLKGWESMEIAAADDVFVAEETVKRTGKAALHVKPQTATQWPWICQKIASINAGATYELRVWAWAHGEATHATPSTYVAIKLEFVDAAGKIVESRTRRLLIMPQEWQQLSLSAQAPLEAISACVYIRIMGAAEIWLDDAELRQTQPAPALWLEPQRLALMPNEVHVVSLRLQALSDIEDEAKTEAILIGPAGKPVKAVSGELKRLDKQRWAGEFSVPALAPGRYIWRVKIGERTAQSTLFVALRERQPKCLNERGAFVPQEGQPMFPIGIYHAVIADYKMLAEQGFNAVQGPATNDVRLLQAAIKEAEQQRLYLAIPLHLRGLVRANLKASLDKIQYFRKSSAILSWKMAEEPEQSSFIDDEIAEAYSQMKQQDKKRFFELTVSNADSYEFWAHFCDGLQIVAFPHALHPSFATLSDCLAQAQKALQPWQHLSVLLPAGYRTGEIVQPTPGQARLMAYLAIIGGAKGIWWYALRERDWKLMDTELWPFLKQLNSEIAALGKVAIISQRIAEEGENPKLKKAVWRHDNKLVVALANPEEETQADVLKLGEAIGSNIKIEQGPVQAEIQEGKLHISLPALEAGWLTISLASSSAQL